MARSKLGDSETVRLQIMIPHDELKAAEAWRYATHQPSTSAAIRELIKKGLEAAGKETNNGQRTP